MADKKKKTTKRGRNSIYDTVILPNIQRIEEWCKNGATEKQMCEALGISVSAFNAHKSKKELMESLKKGRTQLVLDLRGELVRKAKKHTLETKKQYIKVDEVTGNKTQYTEITTKEVDGDLGSIHLLLKNLDRENWLDNPAMHDLKVQELELRKMMAEKDNW